MKLYNIMSPDGFEFSREYFDDWNECQTEFKKWIKSFESQGFYSSTRLGKIPVSQIENYCKVNIIEENITIWVIEAVDLTRDFSEYDYHELKKIHDKSFDGLFTGNTYKELLTQLIANLNVWMSLTQYFVLVNTDSEEIITPLNS